MPVAWKCTNQSHIAHMSQNKKPNLPTQRLWLKYHSQHMPTISNFHTRNTTMRHPNHMLDTFPQTWKPTSQHIICVRNAILNTCLQFQFFRPWTMQTYSTNTSASHCQNHGDHPDNLEYYTKSKYNWSHANSQATQSRPKTIFTPLPRLIFVCLYNFAITWWWLKFH